MKSRLTPYFITLVYDACLKSFWRKSALRKFLRECKISENYLATWSEDETKRDFLDRLFDKLPRTDNGRKALLIIAKFLLEQQSFPDLQNWEDSNEKIKAAHDAVTKLRIYHQQQDEHIVSEKQSLKAKEEFKKRQEKINLSQLSLQKLNDRLNELGKAIGTQKAGYDFQDWFFDLLDFCEVTNRRPYTYKGRQIDGSLTVADTTYLVELKFTTEQSAAPDIDTFFKKVTTKADNTMGVMVSISGFSKTAIEEASGDRTPLLLMDHNHLYYILGGVMGVADVINRIRRHASQTGEAYLAVDKFSG
jgi:Restriction endonuclease